MRSLSQRPPAMVSVSVPLGRDKRPARCRTVFRSVSTFSNTHNAARLPVVARGESFGYRATNAAPDASFLRLR